MTRGQLITFEGIDGSGKSTQAKMLVERLRAKGHDVIHTREPGGSVGAEEIRQLILTGDTDRWSPETEILLFTAARRDHLEKTIRPALEAGQIVVCDRFADSTRIYQGATRGDLRTKVDQLHDLMIGQEPDLTFIIDMDPAIALARGLARPDAEARFEDFGLSFQETVRHGFLSIARAHSDRCV
ncbi:MAG: dTMP kinase, partial [Marivivens sp.]|nr:dTMP kinase [Marivivens sp.]